MRSNQDDVGVSTLSPEDRPDAGMFGDGIWSVTREDSGSGRKREDLEKVKALWGPPAPMTAQTLFAGISSPAQQTSVPTALNAPPGIPPPFSASEQPFLGTLGHANSTQPVSGNVRITRQPLGPNGAASWNRQSFASPPV